MPISGEREVGRQRQLVAARERIKQRGGPYTRLAWEFARQAAAFGVEDGQVSASIRLSDGDLIIGFGSTATVAMQRLAGALMVLDYETIYESGARRAG